MTTQIKIFEIEKDKQKAINYYTLNSTQYYCVKSTNPTILNVKLACSQNTENEFANISAGHVPFKNKLL